MKKKKSVRAMACGEKEIGMAGSNGGQVVSGFWVVLTPAVDIGAKDFSFFGGGKGRRIIKIERVELILFKKKS